MSITISSKKKKKNVDYVVNKDITYSLYCLFKRFIFLFINKSYCIFFFSYLSQNFTYNSHLMIYSHYVNLKYNLCSLLLNSCHD